MRNCKILCRNSLVKSFANETVEKEKFQKQTFRFLSTKNILTMHMEDSNPQLIFQRDFILPLFWYSAVSLMHKRTLNAP